MSKQLSLVPSNQEGGSTTDHRDKFAWQLYLSSALTLDDQKTRDQIQHLNKLLKEWLEERADAFVYLPQQYSDPSRGDKMKPEEIYVLDRWRIAEADLLLVNLDQASFGVGQEAEIATSMGVPIIAFHYHTQRPSRMIRGVPIIFVGDGPGMPSDSVIRYRNQQTYKDLKDELLDKVHRFQKGRTPLAESASAAPSFCTCLSDAMARNGIDAKELVRRTGFTLAFVGHLLSDTAKVESILEPYELLERCRLRRVSEDRFVNPGLWVLRKLASALNVTIDQLVGDDLMDRAWQAPLRLVGKSDVSLEEFVEVAPEVGYRIRYRGAEGMPLAARSPVGSDAEELAREIIAKVKGRRSGQQENE